MNQAFAVTTFCLSIVSISAIIMLHISWEKKFNRIKANIIKMQKMQISLSEKINTLQCDNMNGMLGNISAPGIALMSQEDRDSLRKKIDDIDYQVKLNTQFISDIRQNSRNHRVIPSNTRTSAIQDMSILSREDHSVVTSIERRPEPYEKITEVYQDAVSNRNRNALRRMQCYEVNISRETEDRLTRGDTSQPTKLMNVNGGGSYIITRSEEKIWLFPTLLTLRSFSSVQPQKGLFTYQEERLLAEVTVKRPAEVREEAGAWIVISLGQINTPA